MVGLGRFANRKAGDNNKKSEDGTTEAPPGDSSNAIAVNAKTSTTDANAATDPQANEANASWTDDALAEGFSDDLPDGGGFDFSNAGDEGAFFGASVMDDMSLGGGASCGGASCGGASFGGASFGGDGFATGDGKGTLDGTEENPKERAVTGSATTPGASNIAETARTSFGFSRFANKNQTPSDAAKTTTAVTPNSGGLRITVPNIDTNQKNNGVTPEANKPVPPPQSTPNEAHLPTPTNQSPPPVATDLEVTPPHSSLNSRDDSRRISLENSAVSTPKELPTGKPHPGILPPQHQTPPPQPSTTPDSTGFSIHPVDTSFANPSAHRDVADSLILLSGVSTKGTLVSPQEQHGSKEGEDPEFPPEKFKHVTDNRKQRKKTPTHATAAVIPTPFQDRDAKIQHVPKATPPVPNVGMVPPTIPTPAPGIETVPPPIQGANRVQKRIDSNHGASQDTTTTTNNNNSNNTNQGSFESHQAGFLARVRDTEDLQEQLAAELLDLNEGFSEHYALVLRDLEAAVDLLDQLEDIDRLAETALATFRDNKAPVEDTAMETETADPEGGSSGGSA